MFIHRVKIKRKQKKLAEAVSGFLVTCFEMNTLDEVLKNCGFSPQREPSKNQSTDFDNFLNVPMPLLWNEHRRAQCHA
jgi:hypothetical protein